MMYNNKMAVAVKVDGKVLREVGDIVYLPFGSEYSLYLSNLNNVRASVNISIDGESISDGREFVIGRNSNADIERFLRAGNLAEGNRFKYIERTAGIENHRGIGAQDGLIRFEWRFEKPPQIVYRSGGVIQHSLKTTSVNTSFNVSGEVHDGQAAMAAPVDAGITTEGGISGQKFHEVSSFPLEAESHVTVIRLMGETENNRRVSVPVTTRTKPVCNKCNTRANSYDSKYCGSCGTSLQLVV